MEYDADVDMLVIYRCVKHNVQWLKYGMLCIKCMRLEVLDIRDPDNQRSFLQALKEQGLP